MKTKLFIFLLFSSLNFYSQSKEINRVAMRDLLNDALTDDEVRSNNFYNKGDDLIWDIEIQVEVLYPKTQAEYTKYDDIIFERCKKDIYFHVDSGFNLEFLLMLKNDCQYKNMYFNYSYETLDSKSIRNKFAIDIEKLIAIRLNFNRSEFYSLLRFVPENEF